MKKQKPEVPALAMLVASRLSWGQLEGYRDFT
jgi:hypothetical protein